MPEPLLRSWGWRAGGLPNVSLTDRADQGTIIALQPSPSEWLSPAPTVPPPRSIPAAPATRRSRKAVERAWPQVLNRRSLRADLPFDEAGGDSLCLIRLIFALESQCGTSLDLAAFPGDLRPSDMARALDRCLGKPADRAAEPAAVPDVFLLPAIGGDDPRLVNFAAFAAPP